MGIFLCSKPKKSKKKPKNVFEQEKRQEQKQTEEIKKNADPKNKRLGKLVAQSMLESLSVGTVSNTPTAPPAHLFKKVNSDDVQFNNVKDNKRTEISVPHSSARDSSPQVPMTSRPLNTPTAPPAHIMSYDDAALDEMRNQLNHDANAFLLNNILLSVQFFENYERETMQIKEKPISNDERHISDAMICLNKHVFYADRLLDCVSKHVSYQRNKGPTESIASSRIYVLYDNIEAKEPGNTSDYSAALDAPYYKLQIEDCKESGYLKLRRLEVLESNLNKTLLTQDANKISDDSIYPDSDNELNLANDELFDKKNQSKSIESNNENKKTDIHPTNSDIEQRKHSVYTIKRKNSIKNDSNIDIEQEIATPKKSILKKTRPSNTPTRYIKMKDRQVFNHSKFSGDESELGSSSGYGSILSNGSATSESFIPKRIELHSKSYASSSGVLPNDCWNAVVKKKDDGSDDEDEKVTELASKIRSPNSMAGNSSTDDDSDDNDEMIDSAYKKTTSQSLHKLSYYLNSSIFMNNFIVNFKNDLGSGLGFPRNAISNAMTHGATIYCDYVRDFLKTAYEIIPGVTATWPNAANQWIIRERKIIQNPRNNYKYQWPVKDMVSKARDFGCLLIPYGYRPKNKSNPDQKIQWRITFPAAECFLEAQLAHSHIRCYLFTLVLHKTFMENEMMVGIDASHIKNHLFWECENNFAKWPEDRLGESLMLFLDSLYSHFGRFSLPNYFMERCNEFEMIPASVLLLLQRKLKDIQESPVMHMLYAIDKLKYNSIGFYPTFDCQRLFDILTRKNPLHLSNPNLSTTATSYEESSGKIKRKIKTNVPLPKRLGAGRRHLVLKFFITHFIAMARSSEKFDSINQALIYLEQAQRLCILLLDEPGGDSIVHEYLEVIRDKLADCQRKKAKKTVSKLVPPKKDLGPPVQPNFQQRSKIERILSQDPVLEGQGISAITVADIHQEHKKTGFVKESCTIPVFADTCFIDEDKKKYESENNATRLITVAEVHFEKESSTDRKERRKFDTNTMVEQTKEHHGIALINFSIIDEEHQRDYVTEDSEISVGIVTDMNQIHLDDNIIEESYL